MNSKYQKFFIALFILSLSLRLGLTLVNREANDDHMEVIRLILTTHQLPSLADCRECFHPKLFYVTAVILLQGLGIYDNNAQILFVQFVNFLAGAITLALAWKFIREFPSKNEHIKLIAFALVALNPKLIAINSQISNDSFVILFCTLALFFTYRFLKNPGRNLFWPIVVFILLAVSTKLTGWITFIAIFLSFLLTAWAEKEKRNAILVYAPISLICVLLLTTLNPLSQFISNYQEYGSPTPNSKGSLPLPEFFKQTPTYKKYYYRPGIVSIQDGFLTFKLSDLLEYPLATNEQLNYPAHRTSFWTVLYADTHSLHFQNWPKSWQTTDTEGFNLSRGLLILALLPTLIFIAGFFLEIIIFLKGIFKRDIRATGNGLFLATHSGYILFLLLCALLFRDYAFIKLIYMLPGLLAFIWLFLRGAKMTFNQSRWITIPAYGAIVALLILYVLDVTTMIVHLYSINVQL
jgi:hypothetical protein